MIKKIENLGEGLGVLRKNAMEKLACQLVFLQLFWVLPNFYEQSMSDQLITLWSVNIGDSQWEIDD